MAFAVDGKIFNAQNGLDSLKSIYKKWLSPVFEYEFVNHQQQYQVYIQDDFGNKYRYEKLFPQEEQAKSFVDTLDTAFKFRPDLRNDVFVSRYIHKVLLTSAAGKLLAESRQHFAGKTDADNFGKKVAGKLSSSLKDENEFIKVGRSPKLDRLIEVSTDTYPFVFLNENEFEWKPVEVFYLKKERKRFSILNKKASFQFDSITDFPDTDRLKIVTGQSCHCFPKLLPTRLKKINRQKNLNCLFLLHLKKKARYFESFVSEEIAKKKMNELLAEINNYTYRLWVTDPLPEEWNLNTDREMKTGNFIDYISRGNYISSKLASKAATDFYANLKDLSLQLRTGELLLVLKNDSGNIKTVAQLNKPNPEDKKKAQSILSSGKRLYQSVSDSSEKKINGPSG